MQSLTGLQWIVVVNDPDGVTRVRKLPSRREVVQSIQLTWPEETLDLLTFELHRVVVSRAGRVVLVAEPLTSVRVLHRAARL